MSSGPSIKPRGLSLAYQHQSAEGQVAVEKVYEALDKAKRIDPVLPEVKAERRAHAFQLVLDRVRRLGERVREDRLVDPRDHIRMNQEYAYLRDELVRIVESSKDGIAGVGGNLDSVMTIDRDKALRLLNGVFNGDLTPTAELSRFGFQLGEDVYRREVELAGELKLRDLVKGPVSSSRILQDLAFEAETTAGNVTAAIDTVKDHILTHSRSALSAHAAGVDSVFDPSLLF